MPGKNKELSVLVIEDNLGDYVLIEDFLLDQYVNIRIEHCVDLMSAVETLKSNPYFFSAILLDLHLPDADGLELIKKIIEHSGKVPVIALTGYADLNVAQKGLELGIYDFLIKDEVNGNLLEKTIDYAFSRKSFRNQIEEERQNYKNLFNLSPQPMWFLDSASFQIIDVNESAIEKYGYAMEARGLSYLDLHPAAERDLVVRRLCGDAANHCNHQFTHILYDGQAIKVELAIKNSQFVNGKSGIIVQSADITKITDYVNTIEIQNEKLKNIAWSQSHLVRAPLSRILGIIEVIESHNGEMDDLLYCLAQLNVSSKEMDQIIKKIVAEAQHIGDVEKYK